MTGYAVVECELMEKKYRLHLKSVNNKYFDLKWRAPRNWLSLEYKARKSIQNEFSRGSFDFWVEEIPQNHASSSLATDYLKKLEQTLCSLKDIDQDILSFETAANILSRTPDMWYENNNQKLVEEKDFEIPLNNLILQLKNERKKEGSSIQEALLTLVSHLEEEHKKIVEHVPQLKEKLSEDYKKRIQDLVNQKVMSETFEGRLQSEILFLLERRDISEELDRIYIHIHKLRELLNKPVSNLGKRVDFLGQELNREWSTLGNKIHNTELFECVTESKLSIDKIREQALNLA